MEKETRDLIEVIKQQLYAEAKATYLLRSKNGERMRELLFRTWLKTTLAKQNETLRKEVQQNFVDILQTNEEFLALATLKEKV